MASKKLWMYLKPQTFIGSLSDVSTGRLYGIISDIVVISCTRREAVTFRRCSICSRWPSALMIPLS